MEEKASAVIWTMDIAKSRAAAIAGDLQALDAAAQGQPAAGGSRPRGLPEELRQRFIDLRTALVQRGVFDPVLMRFDTATVSQATTAEVAEQLQKVAASL